MKTKQTYSFKLGERFMLDDIYAIQGLGGGDWWERTGEDKSEADRDLGEDLICTRAITITVIIETDALRAFAVAETPATGTCAVCGVSITQKTRGRHRKYCGDCVERLRHRTPILQSRKSGAENV